MTEGVPHTISGSPVQMQSVDDTMEHSLLIQPGNELLRAKVMDKTSELSMEESPVSSESYDAMEKSLLIQPCDMQIHSGVLDVISETSDSDISKQIDANENGYDCCSMDEDCEVLSINFAEIEPLCQQFTNRPDTPIPGLCPSSRVTPDPSLLDYQTSESGSDFLPVCRFCQQHEERNDPLFAPCRCSGTLQFIHHSCLLHWIEICSKKSRKPPKCEICDYQFNRRKKFKLRQWKCPKISRQDMCLHFIFIFNLLVMVGCATATVMCFLSDKGHISKFPKNKMHLSTEEIITLSCGVLFFVSFFIAMSVEIKAKHTIHKLLLKFFVMNTTWEIEEYDKRRDLVETRLLNRNRNVV